MGTFLNFSHVDSLFWQHLFLLLSGLGALVFLLSAFASFFSHKKEEERGWGRTLSQVGWVFFWLSTGVGLFYLVWRGLEAGHPPWQTLFEVLSFCAVLVYLSYLVIVLVTGMKDYKGAWRGIANLMTAFAMSAAVVLLVIAIQKDKASSDLPPALQSYWMWPHVMAFIFSYATFAVGLVAVLCYYVIKLFNKQTAVKNWLNGFDDFSFRIVAVGFPFMTAALMMGSLWGQDAWGNYWGWDAKEVSALVSWLVYLIYIHLRLVGGWRGEKLFLLLILGALAIITCFLVFSYLPESQSSMHKYAE
ncbi:MAG TPA: hypothetical protein ENK02_06725 [Planctomycetes bacterium]|nr:hypothetical protein [Planctomycetota bacterium]